jgi:hypothetical protein
LLIGAGAAPVQSQKIPDDLDPAKAPPPHQMKPLTSPVRRKTVAAKMSGSVKSFLLDQVLRADGVRV